jgi:tetratricopeptide (TPR) repeat protein
VFLGVEAIHADDETVRKAKRGAARQAAARAIDLAPDGADGYEARGLLRFHELDLAGARSDLERAVQINPSTGEAWMRLGLVYLALGRVPDATAATRRSAELDPLWALRWFALAEALAAAGDLRGAREAALRTLEIAPGELVVEKIRTLDLIDGGAARVLEEAARDQDPMRRLYWTALAERALGRRDEAARALEEFTARYGAEHPVHAAEVQAWASRVDDAFSSLDRALARKPVDGGTAMELRFDPLLRNLHADPRWNAFLRKMNLPVD